MVASNREIDWTLSHLRTELRQRGFTQQEVQCRLGWGKNYLSELFSNNKRLRCEHVLAVLWAIGTDPAAFYARLYRWPINGEISEDRVSEAALLGAEAVFAQVAEELSRQQALLRRKIEESGLTQVEIERRLAWGGGYISRLLKPDSSPRLDQVLAILGVLDLPSELLYAELYAPERAADSDPPPGPDLDAVCLVLAEKGMVTAEEVAAAKEAIAAAKEVSPHPLFKRSG